MALDHRVSSLVRTISLVSILFGLSIFASPGLVAAQNLRSVAVAAADIVYSPLTGHIYAAVPTANAIVTIDPVAGATVGAPLAIGSQPRKLALSDDGAYLYVGLGGASFIKRVHLTPTPVIDLEIPLGCALLMARGSPKTSR